MKLLAFRAEQCLNPLGGFALFAAVFLLPISTSATAAELSVIWIGVASFFLAAIATGVGCRTGVQCQWAHYPVSWVQISAVLALKVAFLVYRLGGEISATAIVSELIQAGIDNKQNVAGLLVFDTVLTLMLWKNVAGLAQQGRFRMGMVVIISASLASLQTGRFLLLSQVALVWILYRSMTNRPINAFSVVLLISGAAVVFPLLHAVRSGDISNDVDIYTVRYMTAILAADASPGGNLLDLVRYVDAEGFNYGKYVAYALLQFIPRAVWPTKPTTSLQADYTHAIYGLDHLDGVTFTFTIFDSYSYGGFPAVVLFSAIWGAVLTLAFKRFLVTRGSLLKLQLALLLINAFNFYRGNITDFFAPVVTVVLIAMLMDKMAKIWLGNAYRS